MDYETIAFSAFQAHIIVLEFYDYGPKQNTVVCITL